MTEVAPRFANLPAPALRALLVVTMLGVLAGALRIDLVHAHEQHAAGHVHADVQAGGHGHATHDDGVPASLHAHDSLAPALLCADAETFTAAWPEAAIWRSSLDQSGPPTSGHGPPHRPPIA